MKTNEREQCRPARPSLARDNDDEGILTQTIRKGSMYSCATLAACLIAGIAARGLDPGMMYCATVMAACFAAAMLQQVWFGYKTRFSLTYRMRTLGFGASFFAVLSLCALAGNWMPADPWAWTTFALIYAGVLATFLAGYRMRFRRLGKTYDELLAEYRAKRAKRSE